jgi:hypothetical protein
MKKGFYYISNNITEKCYYLTGKNKDNKLINFSNFIDGKKVTIINPEWELLFTMPEEETFKDSSYHKLNPTNCFLKVN